MPPWLVLLVSTRPEENIAKRVKDFHPAVIKPDAANNEADVRALFREMLRSAGFAGDAEEEAAVVDALWDRSEGLFLWARFQDQALRKLAIDGRLVPSEIALLPKGVQKAYAEAFTRLLEAFHGDRALY